MPPTPLPVDAVLPELLEALRTRGAVVLESPPGSGKTTRVPVAVAGMVAGQVWVLEPRRVAARAAAQRVASELGERVGETVGYAMRLDRQGGPGTRVWYVTEGVFTRRLDDLPGIDAVILDEFHERSIHTDLALAWCRQLRRSRPELQVVVMSATLDGEAVAQFLDAPRLRATGAVFPVEVRYAERKDDRPLEQRVAAAVRAAEGGVLAFLPGIGEIQRTAALLPDLDVLPLHGELDGAAQDRALRAGPGRKVVLATNVAETSVTVEGIGTVVDSGLARQASFDPWTGLPGLDLVSIARDSAAQRAGRAGRLGPGTCVRLYTRADHDGRPAHTVPEVRRIDLAATVLSLGGRPVDWFEAPPPGAWAAAEGLLRRLGLLGEQGLTALGRSVAELPLSPRLGRLLREAEALGAAREGALLVTLFGKRLDGDLVGRALDGEGDRREAAILSRHIGRRPPQPDGLARALFVAFPDRVGERQGPRVRMADGGAAECEHGRDGFVVVTEVDRVYQRVRARNLTPVPQGWLLDAATLRSTMRWTGDRVEVREELVYGELVLDAAPGDGDPEAVASRLYDEVRERIHNLVPDWARGVATLQRASFLARQGVNVGALPTVHELGLAVCRGCRSERDLAQASLVAAVLGALANPSALDRLAPEWIRLPGRARVPVDYAGDEPHVASRLQDFFGLAQGPRILDGAYPLVLHLNAPSGRPVQVTRDLPGFWVRHYPAIRRELMRRYPRHRWPEDPAALYREEPG